MPAGRTPRRCMNELKNGAKLTDAQVKVLEGRAKMLENSGYKVNSTEGVKTLVGTGWL